eukprot:TRINITY_DN24233_c0_g1_i2.p1 TRINITY_DN24233_c0_g1~~TRINITY_DN24233_c0_g1_i2.p1  ORF type:complete len:275 (+),score=87.57 TRINITY_DN24233_c0_g1_i2:3-827(+)
MNLVVGGLYLLCGETAQEMPIKEGKDEGMAYNEHGEAEMSQDEEGDEDEVKTIGRRTTRLVAVASVGLVVTTILSLGCFAWYWSAIEPYYKKVDELAAGSGFCSAQKEFEAQSTQFFIYTILAMSIGVFVSYLALTKSVERHSLAIIVLCGTAQPYLILTQHFGAKSYYSGKYGDACFEVQELGLTCAYDVVETSGRIQLAVGIVQCIMYLSICVSLAFLLGVKAIKEYKRDNDRGSTEEVEDDDDEEEEEQLNVAKRSFTRRNPLWRLQTPAG